MRSKGCTNSYCVYIFISSSILDLPRNIIVFYGVHGLNQ